MSRISEVSHFLRHGNDHVADHLCSDSSSLMNFVSSLRDRKVYYKQGGEVECLHKLYVGRKSSIVWINGGGNYDDPNPPENPPEIDPSRGYSTASPTDGTDDDDDDGNGTDPNGY